MAGRFLSGGKAALAGASFRLTRSQSGQLLTVELRQRRMHQARIAHHVGVSPTIARREPGSRGVGEEGHAIMNDSNSQQPVNMTKN